MTLNAEDTISRLQSKTVVAAIAAIILNALALIAVFTGKTFDIESIKTALDTWLPIAINTISMLLGWLAYKGRVNATKQINK